MTHQYIKVAEMDKSVEGGVVRKCPGAIVVCANCGQTKTIYADGWNQITVPGDKGVCQSKT